VHERACRGPKKAPTTAGRDTSDEENIPVRGQYYDNSNQNLYEVYRVAKRSE